MSRSGYIDDSPDSQEEQWALIRYRGAVMSAIRGKRGQAFLREMLAALDAMPARRLVAHDLERDGEVCALGSVGKQRGINIAAIDPEDYESVARAFNIPQSLAREIEFENDDTFTYWRNETPEQRWERMRKWVAGQINT